MTTHLTYTLHVVIPAGNTTAVLMVQTHLDGMVELPETFTATIVETCDRCVLGNPSMSYVEILESDSKFTLCYILLNYILIR